MRVYAVLPRLFRLPVASLRKRLPYTDGHRVVFVGGFESPMPVVFKAGNGEFYLLVNCTPAAAGAVVPAHLAVLVHGRWPAVGGEPYTAAVEVTQGVCDTGRLQQVVGLLGSMLVDHLRRSARRRR